MTETKTKPTLRSLVAIMKSGQDLTMEEWRAIGMQKKYDDASNEVVSRGICPNCLANEEPIKSHLLPWEPGNYWNKAGRTCPNCEQFFECGEQPEYEPDPWMGDADPGL
jgi:hypothetical protein